MWQNTKSQIVTKLDKKSICDRKSFLTTWLLNNRWDLLGAAFCNVVVVFEWLPLEQYNEMYFQVLSRSTTYVSIPKKLRNYISMYCSSPIQEIRSSKVGQLQDKVFSINWNCIPIIIQESWDVVLLEFRKNKTF